MRISDIKQQVKNPERYSIYIDEKYAFSLSESELLAAGIRVNQEVTPEELEQLKETAVYDKARMRALNQLSRRPRSEWELRDYLKRKDTEPAIVDRVIAALSERGYVDDRDFARRWVENRRLLKATSQRRLRQELKQKRVSDEAISEALAEDETDEREVLKELVARKRQQTRYQDDQKLIAYLLRQGYNYQDIKTVMNNSDDIL